MELEQKLSGRYKGKMVSFTYPGYSTVHGRVDEVAIDHHGDLILQMNSKRYLVSLEMVSEIIKLLR